MCAPHSARCRGTIRGTNVTVKDRRESEVLPKCAPELWCARGDSNSHALRHWILSPARLPVSPLARLKDYESVSRSAEPVSYSITPVRGRSVEWHPGERESGRAERWRCASSSVSTRS